MATVKDMIAQLQRQRASIDKAIAALEELDGQPAPASSPKPTTITESDNRPKRTLSEQGRERLRAAMKKRWAAKKKAGQVKKAEGR